MTRSPVKKQSSVRLINASVASFLTLALSTVSVITHAAEQCAQVVPGVENVRIFIDENGDRREPTPEEVANLATIDKSLLDAEPEFAYSQKQDMEAYYPQGNKKAAYRTVVGVIPIGAGQKAALSTINIVSVDGPGEGTNDTTPVSPVGGNPGTTLGAQRVNSMVNSATAWANRISSPINIDVEIDWTALACTPSSGTLGSAGPATAVSLTGGGAPNGSAWYHIALADALLETDIITIFLGGVPGDPEVSASFNSSLDDPSLNASCLTGVEWYYGYDGNVPAGDIDFTSTFLHELAHGLCFSTFVNSSGVRPSNRDDVFMLQLYDENLSGGTFWYQMTNAQRAASARDTGNLTWNGANVNSLAGILSAGTSNGHVRMYAPSTYAGGSSVSHWDTVLTPNELMEPFNTAIYFADPTKAAFLDMGWTGNLEQGPLLVDLVSFEAAYNEAENRVILTWETAAEIDNAGFNVYRAVPSGAAFSVGEKLNGGLLPPLGSEFAGAQYEFVDPEPVTSSVGSRAYYLEDIDLYGVRTLHGPAVAEFNAALTAVEDWFMY